MTGVSPHSMLIQIQSECSKLACGGIFGPTTAVIAQWFRKKRGLALGIHATGASIGGTVIPIMARKFIPDIGSVFLPLMM